MERRKTENKNEGILARMYKRYLYLRLPDELKYLDEPDKLFLESAKIGNKAGIRYSLLIGADVNTWDEEGRTPLMWAAGNGHTETARFLIEKGADIHAKNDWGSTALVWAARYGNGGNVETTRILIQKGANVLYAYGDYRTRKTINKIARQKPELFTEKQKLVIDLYSNPRNIPQNKRKEVLKILREFQKKGIITKEKSLELFTNLQKEWNKKSQIEINGKMKKPKNKPNRNNPKRMKGMV